MRHKRIRYQRGSLTTEKRTNGPDVWVYLWRESNPNGSRTQRKRIIENPRPIEKLMRRPANRHSLRRSAEVAL